MPILTKTSTSLSKVYHLLKENAKDSKLELDQEAINFIKAIKGNIYILSLFGETRHGKSFLGTQVAKKFGVTLDTVFKDSASLKSETIGIFMLSTPYNDGTLLILDCEGTGSTDKNNHARIIRMLTMVCNLSSSIMFVNSSGTFQSRSIDSVSSTIELAKATKQIPKEWPSLCFLLNRTSNSIKEVTDQFTKNVPTSVSSYFTDRTIVPIPDQDDDPDQFETNLTIAYDFVVKRLPGRPLKISDEVITGEGLSHYLEQTLESLRDVTINVPVPHDIISNYVVDKIYQECAKKFNDDMKPFKPKRNGQGLFAFKEPWFFTLVKTLEKSKKSFLENQKIKNFNLNQTKKDEINSKFEGVKEEIGKEFNQEEKKIRDTIKAEIDEAKRKRNDKIMNYQLNGTYTLVGRDRTFTVEIGKSPRGGYYFKQSGGWFQCNPNTKVVTLHPGGCDDWETFWVCNHRDGGEYYAFKSMVTGQYLCCDENNKLTCNRNEDWSWERFTIRGV